MHARSHPAQETPTAGRSQNKLFDGFVFAAQSHKKGEKERKREKKKNERKEEGHTTMDIQRLRLLFVLCIPLVSSGGRLVGSMFVLLYCCTQQAYQYIH